MITILSTMIVNEIDGSQQSRSCSIVVTDNSNNYQLGVGGLPLAGDLLPILEARQDELLEVAVSKGDSKTNEQVRHLLYSAAWTNEAFQAAIIENIAENVGGSMSAFADILDKFEAINDEWPIQSLPKRTR